MNETITLSEIPGIAKRGTVRLTTAQALVRYLSGLRTRIEGSSGDEIVPLFGGVFAIFGHGNVAGIGEALYQYRDRLREAAVRAEVQAPVATGIVRRLIDTLANLGI